LRDSAAPPALGKTDIQLEWLHLAEVAGHLLALITAPASISIHCNLRPIYSN